MRNRSLKSIGLLLLGASFMAIAWPFVFQRTELIPMDDAVRASAFAGESFVRLSDGFTRYVLSGPEDGEVVVLVHGFSSPCFIWQRQADALALAGYRVLRYDLFGRGYSDRPDSSYDAELYHRQLIELLDALKVDQPVNIIGLSMGGPITLRFVERAPERVRRFGLIAPAGFGANVPAAAQLLRVPGVAEWVMQALGDRIILGSIEKAVGRPDTATELHKVYEEQLKYFGYKRALLRTLRNHRLTGLEDLFVSVGKLHKPSILFWGENDQVVPFENAERVREAIPDIQFHSIPNGSHTPNYENPDEVNGPLIAFLKSN